MVEKPARKVRKDLNFKTVIIAVILAIVVIVAGLFTFLFFQHSTVIADNVYVNSVHIGGLTVEDATKKIQETVNDSYFDKFVTVNYKEEAYEVDLLKIVKIDPQATAKAAFEKSGSPIAKIFKKDKIVVPFEITVDTENEKKNALHYYTELENGSNLFVFNEDYTTVEVDTSNIDSLVSIDGTFDVIIENAKNDIYDSVEAVIVKAGDEGFAEELYSRLARPAVDASVGMNDDKSTYIIPETVGINADKDEFLKLYKENNGKFSMSVQPIYPQITTDDLDIEFYQDVLGSYTSAYNVGLVNRTKNVTLAANFVNGTIIMPGKRFSYNNVVGKRTAERGFVKATVYTGEGTEEGLGGGICQVSSTIYCAQLRANLKTVSRTNHSYTVAYVPLGQDATVVYGAIDYIFENDTNYPIKIQAYAKGGYLTVNIMGTNIDKSLTYDVVSARNSTIEKKEVQKDDPTLPIGETKVKQSGQNGAVVSTYKVYYKDGVEQKREYIGKSTYMAMNKIVLVGTGEPVEIPDGETDVKPDTDTDVNRQPDTEIDNPSDIPVDTTQSDYPDTELDTDIDIETDVPTLEEEFDIPTSDTGL